MDISPKMNAHMDHITDLLGEIYDKCKEALMVDNTAPLGPLVSLALSHRMAQGTAEIDSFFPASNWDFKMTPKNSAVSLLEKMHRDISDNAHFNSRMRALNIANTEERNRQIAEAEARRIARGQKRLKAAQKGGITAQEKASDNPS